MAFSWVKKIFGNDVKETSVTVERAEIIAKLAARDYAYSVCVKRIATSLGKVKWIVTDDETRKKEIEYLLNVSPNPNQSSPEFWRQLIFSLYSRGDALVYVYKDSGRISFYVADSFHADRSGAFVEWAFKDVQIRDITLRRSLRNSEVIYLRLEDGTVRDLLSAILKTYSDLLEVSEKLYTRSGEKYKLTIDRMAENDADELEEILNKDVKKFVESTTAAFPEYEGYKLDTVSSGRTSTQYTTRDYNALVNDMIELTERAFLMPSNLAAGEVADTSRAYQDYLSFCLGPLVNQIATELTRKLYGPSDYYQGRKVTPDLTFVKSRDILESASSVDKLLSTGVQSVNELRERFEVESINEPWANTHYVTKNYESVNATNSSEDKEETENTDE